MINTKIMAAILLVTTAPMLSSCAQLASLEDGFDNALYNVVGKPLEYLEDSIRGYRVDFVTIPAGATVTCGNEELGRAPFKKWFDLSESEKDKQVFHLSNCIAQWKSGTISEIEVDVPLSQYPRNVYIVEERPIDHPGQDIDEAFGREFLAYQQQMLEQAATGIISFASTVHQITKSSSSTNSFGNGGPFDIPQFYGVQAPGGITWNWVSSGSSESSFMSSSPSTSSFNVMTPVVPASSCSGAIVMGKCAGAITAAPSGVQAFCAGSFINGRCMGSVIFGD